MFRSAVEPVAVGSAFLPESVRWDPRTNKIQWVDIIGGSIRQLSGAYRGGASNVESLNVFECDETIGFIEPTDDKDIWIAGIRTRLTLVDLSTGEELDSLCELSAVASDIRFNDGRTSTHGTIVAGTMALDARPNAGSLYEWDGSEIHSLIDGVTISNGLDWDSNGALWYIDTPTQKVQRYTHHRPGLAQPAPDSHDLADALGSPDGMIIDATGNFWVAMWGTGQVLRLTDGSITGVVDVPLRFVTSVAIDDSNNLWVTAVENEPSSESSSGGLFRSSVPDSAAQVRFASRSASTHRQPK